MSKEVNKLWHLSICIIYEAVNHVQLGPNILSHYFSTILVDFARGFHVSERVYKQVAGYSD